MTSLRRAALGVVALLGALGAGCGHAGPVTVKAPASGAWVVVPGVTVYTQRGDTDCGPAALATLLSRWGIAPATAAAPAPAEGRGNRAGELRDEARRLGFRSYVFEGSFDDLDFEIANGRPVLLGLVRSVEARRSAHFVVVVGREMGGGRWLLADPALGLAVVAREHLARQWSASGFVTLVLEPADGRAEPSARAVRAAL